MCSNGDWIKNSHNGLIICDATSAAFAMDIDWSKLDVGTFSGKNLLRRSWSWYDYSFSKGLIE